MKKRGLELLTLLFSVITTIACVSNGTDVTQTMNAAPNDQTAKGLTLEIPDAHWEPVFFQALEERTKKPDCRV